MCSGPQRRTNHTFTEMREHRIGQQHRSDQRPVQPGQRREPQRRPTQVNGSMIPTALMTIVVAISAGLAWLSMNGILRCG